MKSKFLHETQQHFKMAERANRVTGLPASAKIKDQTSGGCQYATKFGGVTDKPVNIAVLADIAVFFLEV